MQNLVQFKGGDGEKISISHSDGRISRKREKGGIQFCVRATTRIDQSKGKKKILRRKKRSQNFKETLKGRGRETWESGGSLEKEGVRGKQPFLI